MLTAREPQRREEGSATLKRQIERIQEQAEPRAIATQGKVRVLSKQQEQELGLEPKIIQHLKGEATAAVGKTRGSVG